MITALVHRSREIEGTKPTSRLPDSWGRALKLVDDQTGPAIWVYPKPWQYRPLVEALTASGFVVTLKLPASSA